MRAARVLACFVCASVVRGDGPRPEIPGPRPGGFTVLHNQWPIHPVGDQVGLGDFPVAAAVDPTGRYAAVLHAGYGAHEIRVIDLRSERMVGRAPVHEAFCGIAFSSDGSRLACSGGSDGVLHLFSLRGGVPSACGDVRVADASERSVVAGFALSRDLRSAVVALAYSSRIARVDLRTGSPVWSSSLAPAATAGAPGKPYAPNEAGEGPLIENADPLSIVWDEGRGRAYASLWGESSVAVLDSATGRVLARWPTGLHPNEMLLSADGRLFVSNGGLNTVSVLDVSDGRVTEVLSCAAFPGEPPGSTPDSLALSRDASTLYVANASTNTVAVFNVAVRGRGTPLGFIPTGWFPTSVRLTPDGRRLVVVSARGLEPVPSAGAGSRWRPITGLYSGSLAILELGAGDKGTRRLASWTRLAQRCRPAAPAEPTVDGPIPASPGAATPIRYVVYVIKENRTYDQVLGDVPEGNGDPSLCLFPERTTPNTHALARQFVLLDNFYANAEVSAGGHEWSMAGYASEFVEKSWPINYGHLKDGTHVPYPSEGRYAAALPALGYLWDKAAAAGVTYRSYGEFTVEPPDAAQPETTHLHALEGHLDPAYRGWDLRCHDTVRAAEFIAQLHGFEAAGTMPRLQIVRLPQDHTAGALAGAWTPEAMVADNDLALGRIVEALSRSRFWRETAVFVVEDDAQSGPDHVDAHRTVALVAGGCVRRGFVDSTPYTTCSMLRTMELILGLTPMSPFDAAAAPMRASFQPHPDAAPYSAVPAGVDIEARNKGTGPLARLSARFDFSREDLVDDAEFNRVIWASVRGEGARVPPPVHAAFVRGLPAADPDDDD